MRTVLTIAALLAGASLVVLPQASAARVHQSSEQGFVVRHQITVPVSAEEAWERVISPQFWWSGEHSFSGDASNFSLDARPGGCFCETLPPAEGATSPRPRGGVEHMRVVYVERPRALRLSGGLGPLQAEGVAGALTIMLKPGEAGTSSLMEYVVGGFMRFPIDQIAPAVDAVIGEQAQRLGEGLGARVSEPPTDPSAADEAPAQDEPQAADDNASSDFASEMAEALGPEPVTETLGDPAEPVEPRYTPKPGEGR